VWAPLETDPIVDERIREIAMENAPWFLRPDLAKPAPPAEDRLHEIQAPTMVIAGADHLVNVRAPEKFNRTVLDFLALIEL
jgi:pimeloyl-ACP methyl ester carboxylesterase